MLNIGTLVKGYNNSARGYPELLPFMCLWDEETVATLDQGLLAYFEFEGVDGEGRSDSEVGYAVEAFERAFASFGAGATVWTYVDRRKTTTYPDATFLNPTSKYIDDTWRERITANQYENIYTIAIHQRSNFGTLALFDAVDLIVKDEGIGLLAAFIKAIKSQLSLKERRRLDERKMKAAKTQLDANVESLMVGMRSLGLKRLKGDRLMAELHNRVNPASPHRATFPVPTIPSFVSNLICTDTLRRTPESLVFRNEDEKHVGVISLKGFSGDSQTVAGQMDSLVSLQGEITVAHCFRFMDRAVAEKTIQDIERYNIAKSVPFLHRMITILSKEEPSKFNEGRLALANDAKEALVDLYRNNRAFGHHNLTVLCFGETEREMHALRRETLQRITHSRFSGHVERMHALSAFAGTIPGQWGASVRWNFVSYGNAADIAPIRTIRRGNPVCEHFVREKQRHFPALASVPTTAGSPVYIDLWEKGVGHMKIIGPTRAGKSIIENFILAQFRKFEPCRTIVIDKDYSCKVPTLLQGGLHIDLTQSHSNHTQLAPLSLLSDERHLPFLVNWVLEMIQFGRSGQQASPQEIELVTQGLRGLAVLDKEHWTLSYLASTLSRELGAYVEQWCQGSANGNWFDNPPTLLNTANHICFECKDLFNNKVVASLAMSYLFYIIEGLLDGTPTIVSIEETWFFLGADDQRFADKIDDFLRTLGKRNGSLWIVTQTLQEIDNCPIRNSILSNIPNTMYLPDRNIHQQVELYRDVGGLLPEEIERIAMATEKRHYYLKTPSVSRMLDMELPQEIVVCLSSSDRARRTFDKHYESKDLEPNWINNYHQEMLYEAA